MSAPLNPDACVLLAEDEPSLSTALSRALTRKGHQVTVVHNGADALEMLERQEFDAMVSDIGLPGLSGIQLLDSLHRKRPDIPVILMTGAPSLETALDGFRHNAYHYLPKPFDLIEFCQIVDSALASRMSRKATVSRALGRFLSNFWVAYQPIVNRQGAVYGYEALMRSRDPVLPHPGAVIEAAIEHQRLFEIGDAVRERCVEGFLKHGAQDRDLFVNLHPSELLNPSLYLSNNPLSEIADRVVIEITERSCLDHIDALEDRLLDLRRQGFRIAVDDLGVGYSSLTSLLQIRPEIIKLDRSIVNNIHQSRDRQSIVQCLLAMRDALDTLVVAEGVETRSELNTLLDLGCDLFQGYYIARPAPPMPSVTWPGV